MNIADLSAEFPRNVISWRAQSLTKAGDKALALAYIDARDVMERLDAICGPENWQDRYEFHGTRTICYLSIRIGDEWITKADGAGDSDVEAEKGAISDALKRAAVKWGIGRYLYAIVSPWVPCDTYDSNGKKHWKAWTVDPWTCVRGAGPAPKPAASLPPASTASEPSLAFQSHAASIRGAETLEALQTAFNATKADKTLNKAECIELVALKDARKAVLLPPAKNLGEHLDRLQAAEGANA